MFGGHQACPRDPGPGSDWFSPDGETQPYSLLLCGLFVLLMFSSTQASVNMQRLARSALLSGQALNDSVPATGAPGSPTLPLTGSAGDSNPQTPKGWLWAQSEQNSSSPLPLLTPVTLKLRSPECTLKTSCLLPMAPLARTRTAENCPVDKEVQSQKEGMRRRKHRNKGEWEDEGAHREDP